MGLLLNAERKNTLRTIEYLDALGIRASPALLPCHLVREDHWALNLGKVETDDVVLVFHRCKNALWMRLLPTGPLRNLDGPLRLLNRGKVEMEPATAIVTGVKSPQHHAEAIADLVRSASQPDG